MKMLLSIYMRLYQEPVFYLLKNNLLIEDKLMKDAKMRNNAKTNVNSLGSSKKEIGR